MDRSRNGQALPCDDNSAKIEVVYIATPNLDFIAPIDTNAYNRLLNALTQAGWEYSGTSATTLIDGGTPEVLWALEVLARGIPQVGGELGALSLQVQSVGHPRPAPAAQFQNPGLLT